MGDQGGGRSILRMHHLEEVPGFEIYTKKSYHKRKGVLSERQHKLTYMRVGFDETS